SLMSLGLLPRDYEESVGGLPHAHCDRFAFKYGLLRAVFAGGLYPNIVHVVSDQMDLKLVELSGEQVHVHPQSACAGCIPYDWSLLVYHRKSRTNK
ncbi:unnamed protein product, partial [Polarella glacialis]